MTLPTDPAARKRVPLWRAVHEYFPAALAGVARVTVAGSRQHHGGDVLFDDRSKSNDDADCLLRHLHDAFTGDGMDGDVAHVDKVAWRALRLAQKWHEAHGAPVAPAARNVATTVKLDVDGHLHGPAARYPTPTDPTLGGQPLNPVRQDTGD